MTNYQKKGFLTEDYRLFHLRSSTGTRTEFHYHEFCKILLVVSGSGGYTVEGQRYALQTGDIILVDSFSVHRPEFEPGAVYERIILYISPEFLRRAGVVGCDLAECFRGERGHLLRLGEPERKKLFALAAELEREKRRQQAVLTIRKKYGKNAILKGMNYQEGATTRDRNAQIGGHKA